MNGWQKHHGEDKNINGTCLYSETKNMDKGKSKLFFGTNGLIGYTNKNNGIQTEKMVYNLLIVFWRHCSTMLLN